MTISANYTFDLTRDSIIRVAYQLVGVLEAGREPDVNQVTLATDLMGLELDAFQSEGVSLRHLERTTTTLTAGTAQYTLAADTLDVDPGTIYVTDRSGGDLPVELIPRHRYMAIVTKTTQGQPTQMYVEKGQTFSFFLYPVPDSSWTSITYPRIRLRRDMDSGSVTADVARKYLKALAFLLAADLAFHHGLLEKEGALRARGEAALGKAEADDTERGNTRFVPDVGIQFWSRH